MELSKSLKFAGSAMGIALTIIGLGGLQDDLRQWISWISMAIEAMSQDYARTAFVAFGVVILLVIWVPAKTWRDSVWQKRTLSYVLLAASLAAAAWVGSIVAQPGPSDLKFERDGLTLKLKDGQGNTITSFRETEWRLTLFGPDGKTAVVPESEEARLDPERMKRIKEKGE